VISVLPNATGCSTSTGTLYARLWHAIEIILQRAKEKCPDAQPRIISDNGPQFIARILDGNVTNV
jgi:hypothetical protein